MSANPSGTPDLSIVVPVYNEEENVAVLADEIDEALAGRGRSYEVLFVNDGSTDASLAVLQRLQEERPHVQVLSLRRNSGQSAALAAGFFAARAPVVVTLDADLQNDPADIPRLVDELAGYDLVSGVRAARHDSWVRKVSSRIANRVRSRILHDGITDVGCSLKAYRSELLRYLPTFQGMHRFLPALLQMRGARVKEVPVNHRPRIHGVSKYGIHNRLWRGIADLAAVRWMQSRWIDRELIEEVERLGRVPRDSGREGPGRVPRDS